jgi:hypothetical protein
MLDKNTKKRLFDSWIGELFRDSLKHKQNLIRHALYCSAALIFFLGCYALNIIARQNDLERRAKEAEERAQMAVEMGQIVNDELKATQAHLSSFIDKLPRVWRPFPKASIVRLSSEDIAACIAYTDFPCGRSEGILSETSQDTLRKTLILLEKELHTRKNPEGLDVEEIAKRKMIIDDHPRRRSLSSDKELPKRPQYGIILQEGFEVSKKS